ncbi:MAG: chemotaxis protein CheA [Clostridiaceae bacterium]
MSNDSTKEPMLDMFIFETQQLIEQLEQEILTCEKSGSLDQSINEIFRIMHTIKGSSAMMLFNNITTLAHSIEDLFFYIRDKKPVSVDQSRLIDIVLEGTDFIKNEIVKIESGSPANGSPAKIIKKTETYLDVLSGTTASEPTQAHDKIKHGKAAAGIDPAGIGDQGNKDTHENNGIPLSSGNTESSSDPALTVYRSTVFFEDGSEMENIRAFALMNHLKQIAEILRIDPDDITENNHSADMIKNDGFKIEFRTAHCFDELKALFEQTIFLKSLELTEVKVNTGEPDERSNDSDMPDTASDTGTANLQKNTSPDKNVNASAIKQSMISVSVSKLDMLMDMVGELVISEAMVIHNPELDNLQLDGFLKASRQLHKIIGELQDIVMSIRMVPLSVTFQKMNRIVRDMSHKLEKEVKLEIIGEETEVDKNIIEHISDPLMHLIRNSLDHGIEHASERIGKGKPAEGKIILEAKNSGGDVWITVRDDGKGLNKEKILQKAIEKGITNKSEAELTEKEIYSFILLPGFSTKESVTEFSGRGVGMDVVVKNIEKIGGTVIVESTPGAGATISVKIPLTLAIIDGMVIRVGNARYIIPTASIKESFKVGTENVITDTSGNEMIMVRGSCYPILRVKKLFNLSSGIADIHDGIIVMVENNGKSTCIFTDSLLGQQQVVVKALPGYIKKVKGVSGCTLLGDGGIGLILDIAGLIGS